MASVASRLSVLNHFVEAVGVSDYLGCNGLLEFLLGCSGLSRLSLFRRQFVEADDLTAWGFSGLSSFFWAAVASRDSLACSKHGLFSIALFVGCDLLCKLRVFSRIVPLGNKHFVLM